MSITTTTATADPGGEVVRRQARHGERRAGSPRARTPRRRAASEAKTGRAIALGQERFPEPVAAQRAPDQDPFGHVGQLGHEEDRKRSRPGRIRLPPTPSRTGVRASGGPERSDRSRTDPDRRRRRCGPGPPWPYGVHARGCRMRPGVYCLAPTGQDRARDIDTGRTIVHIVIMGCGRVGSALAQHPGEAGPHGRRHRSGPDGVPPSAVRASAAGASPGSASTRTPCAEAGIEEAGAFAAVSSGDNSNIIAARVARETFGVENVVARIYDPRRAEVYQRLGIPTVATVRWTADQMLRRLLPSGRRAAVARPERQRPAGRGPGLPRLGRPPADPAGGGRRRARGVPHPTGRGRSALGRHRPPGGRPGARDACAPPTLAVGRGAVRHGSGGGGH